MAAPALAGPPGFAFLEVPAGARAGSLGGAYASVATGAEAAFWNPAGLAGFTGTQVSASHTEWIEHLRQDQFALAGRMFGGGLAASLRAMYSEPIDERDDLGNLIGTFGTDDLEFLLGYGRALSAGTSFGATAQVLHERIANVSATTWALGAGAAWDVQALGGPRLSLSAHNLGPAAHYLIDGARGAPVPLPMAMQAGVSWRRPVAQGFTALGAVESRLTRGRQAVVAVGAELDSRVGAALRVGLRTGDDLSRFSYGAGYRLGGLRLDYAFVPSELDLADTQRFSLNAQF